MVKWTQANTATDLVASYAPLIKGKVILTTGVTAGSIGATYVETVATAQPALLILAGRNASKLDEEAANIAAAAEAAGVSPVPTRNLVVDLLSLDSVRKAAAEVNAWDDVPVIDVLHNCAGIMAVPYKLSADGYESQFAANHLSHFLFTNLILDKILASKSPRIVNVSSNGHRLGPMRWDDLNFDVSVHPPPPQSYPPKVYDLPCIE
jgi:NAD(P)-dependent dehydrogenase (short-subunit alcohol dehydrogenase family)